MQTNACEDLCKNFIFFPHRPLDYRTWREMCTYHFICFVYRRWQWGLDWVGLHRSGCRLLYLTVGVVNPWPITSVIHWRFFFFAGEPESEHAFGHFINLSVHQRNDSMRSVDKSALAFPLQWVAVCHTPPGFPPCGIVMKNWWKSWGFRFYSPIAPSEISLTETIRRTN